jgi:hypothetical protein
MHHERKYARRQASDYYLVIDRISGMMIGRIVNMSPNGMMIVGNAAVPIGQTFQLKLKLPSVVLGADHLFIEAECRWASHNRRHDWWEAGFVFKEIPTYDRKVLQQIVIQLMNGQDEWVDPEAKAKSPEDEKISYVRMRPYRRHNLK